MTIITIIIIIIKTIIITIIIVGRELGGEELGGEGEERGWERESRTPRFLITKRDKTNKNDPQRGPPLRDEKHVQSNPPFKY